MSRTGNAGTRTLTGHREDRPSCDPPQHEGLLRSAAGEVKQNALSRRR
jgi:hypothetical protein